MILEFCNACYMNRCKLPAMIRDNQEDVAPDSNSYALYEWRKQISVFVCTSLSMAHSNHFAVVPNDTFRKLYIPYVFVLLVYLRTTIFCFVTDIRKFTVRTLVVLYTDYNIKRPIPSYIPRTRPLCGTEAKRPIPWYIPRTWPLYMRQWS